MSHGKHKYIFKICMSVATSHFSFFFGISPPKYALIMSVFSSAYFWVKKTGLYIRMVGAPISNLILLSHLPCIEPFSCLPAEETNITDNKTLPLIIQFACGYRVKKRSNPRTKVISDLRNYILHGNFLCTDRYKGNNFKIVTE